MNHDLDKIKRIVRENYPEAIALYSFSDDGISWRITNRLFFTLSYSEPTVWWDNEHAAWESAYFELIKLNAWLDYEKTGDTPWANWFKAEEKLEHKR